MQNTYDCKKHVHARSQHTIGDTRDNIWLNMTSSIKARSAVRQWNQLFALRAVVRLVYRERLPVENTDNVANVFGTQNISGFPRMAPHLNNPSDIRWRPPTGPSRPPWQIQLPATPYPSRLSRLPKYKFISSGVSMTICKPGLTMNKCHSQ